MTEHDEIRDRQNKIRELSENGWLVIVGVIGIVLTPILIGLVILLLDVVWYWQRRTEINRLQTEIFILAQNRSK